ncbi:MAG: Methyltransferase, partial [Candidatus Dadabacteria bacterium]|nr:Methyltransferase [Candidatus Dadabacteria bacterium]
MEEKNIFTTKEAAKYLGISQSTVYRMEKQGLISSTRTPGGQRRFSRETIERYLKESQNFEAPQNPSKYKKTGLLIKETESSYLIQDKKQVTSTKTSQIDEPFFHGDSILIYNTDILRINCVKENFIDLIVTSP